jgi:hypothetical protein
VSIPPTGPSPAQPAPQGPDLKERSEKLVSAMQAFIEDIKKSKQHPHLVDSPQALETFAGHVKELHQMTQEILR